jgi:hypothetical protein
MELAAPVAGGGGSEVQAASSAGASTSCGSGSGSGVVSGAFFVMRGVAGSGKSTLVSELVAVAGGAADDVVVCSADTFLNTGHAESIGDDAGCVADDAGCVAEVACGMSTVDEGDRCTGNSTNKRASSNIVASASTTASASVNRGADTSRCALDTERPHGERATYTFTETRRRAAFQQCKVSRFSLRREVTRGDTR